MYHIGTQKQYIKRCPTNSTVALLIYNLQYLLLFRLQACMKQKKTAHAQRNQVNVAECAGTCTSPMDFISGKLKLKKYFRIILNIDLQVMKNNSYTSFEPI